MNRLRDILLAAICLWCLSGSAARAGEVQFASLGDGATIKAHLLLPDTEPPHPAVVFLHGCSGLGRNGAVFGIYSAWARRLVAEGYAVMMVDSAGSRGLETTCGPGDGRASMYRNRPGDAYGALAYLQAQPSIAGDGIALMGWSQGGGIVLLTIVKPSIGRPDPAPRQDFRAAIALYPSACNDRQQSRPFTEVEPNGWTTDIPLLVLQGGADNWTLARPCQRFISMAKARGEPVDIVVHPHAVHAFDAPSMPVHERPGTRLADGSRPLIGTDEAARAAAMDKAAWFLAEKLRR